MEVEGPKEDFKRGIVKLLEPYHKSLLSFVRHLRSLEFSADTLEGDGLDTLYAKFEQLRYYLDISTEDREGIKKVGYQMKEVLLHGDYYLTPEELFLPIDDLLDFCKTESFLVLLLTMMRSLVILFEERAEQESVIAVPMDETDETIVTETRRALYKPLRDEFHQLWKTTVMPLVLYGEHDDASDLFYNDTSNNETFSALIGRVKLLYGALFRPPDDGYPFNDPLSLEGLNVSVKLYCDMFEEALCQTFGDRRRADTKRVKLVWGRDDEIVFVVPKSRLKGIEENMLSIFQNNNNNNEIVLDFSQVLPPNDNNRLPVSKPSRETFLLLVLCHEIFQLCPTGGAEVIEMVHGIITQKGSTPLSRTLTTDSFGDVLLPCLVPMFHIARLFERSQPNGNITILIVYSIVMCVRRASIDTLANFANMPRSEKDSSNGLPYTRHYWHEFLVRKCLDLLMPSHVLEDATKKIQPRIKYQVTPFAMGGEEGILMTPQFPCGIKGPDLRYSNNHRSMRWFQVDEPYTQVICTSHFRLTLDQNGRLTIRSRSPSTVADERTIPSRWQTRVFDESFNGGDIIDIWADDMRYFFLTTRGLYGGGFGGPKTGIECYSKNEQTFFIEPMLVDGLDDHYKVQKIDIMGFGTFFHTTDGLFCCGSHNEYLGTKGSYMAIKIDLQGHEARNLRERHYFINRGGELEAEDRYVLFMSLYNDTFEVKFSNSEMGATRLEWNKETRLDLPRRSLYGNGNANRVQNELLTLTYNRSLSLSVDLQHEDKPRPLIDLTPHNAEGEQVIDIFAVKLDYANGFLVWTSHALYDYGITKKDTFSILYKDLSYSQ